jgi:hypothetical protein
VSDSPITLENVSLVTTTSVALSATVDALHASMRQAQFGEVLLLSDQRPPTEIHPSIRWRRIARLASRADYSRFMLRELADHVRTSHALCIQWDGFVLNGHAWDPSFLDFDYIGAVWPQFDDGHDVGNGGFSLRSKRLLNACKQLPFDGTVGEDVTIGRKCRAELEASGIRFAPAAVARRFAYERTPPTGQEFGFHGAFNLVKHVSPDDAFQIFRSLEPLMLNRNERRELLWWALKRRRLGLASMMLKRLISNLLQRGNNLG